VNKYATKKTFITLFLVKGTPGLAIPSLILIGRGKLTFKEFILNLLPISIVRNVILSFLGYSSILSVEAIYNYYGYTKAFSYVAILLVIAVVLFFERHHLKVLFRNVVKKRLSKDPS
jgi:membrane protein DedA with SNARE-associated domain